MSTLDGELYAKEHLLDQSNEKCAGNYETL